MSWLYTIIFAGLTFSSTDAEVPLPVELPRSDAVVVEFAKGDETERFEQTYPLNANGRVSVSNVNGSITLGAWDRNEVKLIAVKTAETKEMLDYVEIKIDAKPDHFNVETDYENWKRNAGGRWKNHGKIEIDFQLMVPRGAVLNEIETVNGSVEASNFTNITRISAVNGAVKATNIRGTAKLCTVNGEVLADFDRLENGSKISLETVNGRVNLMIPSDSNATVKADSLNGNITNDFGLTVRKGKYVGRDLYGRIGNGDVQIKLNSVNGGLSIGRKNDGKNLSPATNLQPQKGDEWHFDENEMVAKADKLSKDAMKVKVVVPKVPDIAKINTEAIARSVESSVKAAQVSNKGELDRSVREVARAEARLLRSGNTMFERRLPTIETKSGSFSVKGVPNVAVEAKSCSVKVIGWERPEVQYRVTHVTTFRSSEPLKISDTHSDTAVTIKVEAQNGRSYFATARVEVFVPKRSNLKITAGGEIRLDGVSGDIELVGSDETINVRDVNGRLNVRNSDGRIRVVGFRGSIEAATSDGDINLDGDFQDLKATSNGGAISLVLPEDASANLTANCDEVRGDGILITRIGGEENEFKYRIGRGGAPFQIHTDGAITIRGAASLSDTN